MLNLAILYLQYDIQKYGDSLGKLKKYLSGIKLFKKTIFIIDNKNEDKPLEEIEKNIYYTGGDNSCWEFSGWQKGYELLKNSNIKYDIVLFVNDSFQSYGGSYLEYINDYMVLKSLFKNYAMGEIDGYDEEIRVFDYTLKKYIRSNCYFIPKKILDKMNGICLVDNKILDEIIDKDFNNRYFTDDKYINTYFQKNIINWLQNEWHSKFIIKDNWNLFRNKTRAMLNEIALSGEIQKTGAKIKRYK